MKLLKPDTIKPSLEELKKAFPDSEVWLAMDMDETKCSCAPDSVCIQLNPAISRYSDSLDIIYVNPAILTPPLEYREGNRLSSIRMACLFEEGLRCHVDVPGMGSQSMHILFGHFVERIGSRQYFMVNGDGATPDGYCLILIHNGDLVTPDFSSALEREALFTIAIPDRRMRIHVVKCEGQPADIMTATADDILKAMQKTSSLHFAELSEAILEDFPKKFDHLYCDDGVMYSDAWLLDEYGREIPPDAKREIPLSRADGGLYKTWFALTKYENRLCCSCKMEPDGHVELACEQLKFEKRITELQRRRMEIIRRSVIERLQANHLRLADNLDGFVAPRWDTCSYYKGVKMQL